MSHYYQIADVFPHLKNPKKYKGTRPITARSSWEGNFILKYLDKNENILEWGSESVVINYLLPTDGRNHRYFMDFNIVAKMQDGSTKQMWIEIKPFSQTQPPKEPTRKSKNYFKQVETYIKNQAKWETTKRIVEQKQKQGENIEFVILTEKELKGII